MRILIAAALLTSGLASFCLGVSAQERSPCHGDPGCPREYPLRLGTATSPGVPLVWSATQGRLVPPPVRQEPIVLGRTIPLGEIIGRKVHPLGRLPEPVIYNKPPTEPDSGDPSFVLMSLGPVPRPVLLRRAD